MTDEQPQRVMVEGEALDVLRAERARLDELIQKGASELLTHRVLREQISQSIDVLEAANVRVMTVPGTTGTYRIEVEHPPVKGAEPTTLQQPEAQVEQPGPTAIPAKAPRARAAAKADQLDA